MTRAIAWAWSRSAAIAALTLSLVVFRIGARTTRRLAGSTWLVARGRGVAVSLTRPLLPDALLRVRDAVSLVLVRDRVTGSADARSRVRREPGSWARPDRPCTLQWGLPKEPSERRGRDIRGARRARPTAVLVPSSGPMNFYLRDGKSACSIRSEPPRRNP